MWPAFVAGVALVTLVLSFKSSTHVHVSFGSFAHVHAFTMEAGLVDLEIFRGKNCGIRFAKYCRNRRLLFFHFSPNPQYCWHRYHPSRSEVTFLKMALLILVGRRQICFHRNATVPSIDLGLLHGIPVYDIYISSPMKRPTVWHVSLFINFLPNVSEFGTRRSNGEVS